MEFNNLFKFQLKSKKLFTEIIFLNCFSYRQTLIFSSVALPEIKSVINKKCHNYAGRILVENPTDIGSIQQVLVQVPQVFHR